MSVVKVRIAQSRTRLKRLSSSSSSSSISCVCTYKHKSTYLLLYFFALYHLRFTHLERITDTEKYIIRTLNNNYNFRGNARLFDSFIWSLKKFNYLDNFNSPCYNYKLRKRRCEFGRYGQWLITNRYSTNKVTMMTYHFL